MKKTFVKVSLLSMMLSLMPVAMTSCKDYDDDITEINGTTSELGTQIAAINAAIQANKDAAQAASAAADAALKAAQAAQATGDQAEKDAQNAMAVAKSAEAAAAQAKADALAEIKLLAEKLGADIEAIKNNQSASEAEIQANKDAIAALVGRIEGVEKGLANIDLDGLNASISELNTALEAVNVQITALKGYESRLSALESQFSGISGDVATAKTNITNLQKDLADLKTKAEGLQTQINANKDSINSLKGDISTLRGQLTDLSAKISTEVANGVNTIAGVVSQRLTSVTLMPDMYIDGIPTIEFKSANYRALVWKSVNGEMQWVREGQQYIVSNNKTEIEYRLNPGTVRTEDIKAGELSFVSRIATTRAAEQDNDIITAISGEVSGNGVLKVTAGKSNTNSLNLAGNKIYTVSLKVPIAQNHLFKGEGAACVYSEYSRLSEIYFTPELRKTDKVAPSIDAHFNDSATIYKSNMNQLVAAKVQYNQTLNLNNLVQGCEFVNPSTHTPVTLETLKEYGFEVSYAIAKKAYNTLSSDRANQQEFAEISGATLTPGSPTPGGFAAGNQTAIGKQPIVRVTLADVKNHKIVDQKYFKVLITREDPKPLNFTITPAKNAELACGPYTWNVTWDEMAKQVLSQFPNGGISKEDFNHRYGAHASSVEVMVNGVVANDLADNVSDNVTLDNTGASIPVMSFTLDNNEIGKLKQGKSKTYTITLNYTDKNDLNPDVAITFTCVITNNIKNPVIGQVDPVKWKSETMLLYPIPYGSANAQKNAEYDTNILEGRYNPLVTGVIPCGRWNLAFAQSYNGASMTYPSGFGGWMDQQDAQLLKQINVAIEHTDAGINLVQNGTKLALDWNVRLNGLAENNETFAKSYLQIVKPLKDPQIDNSVVLNDKPYQQEVLNLNKKVTLKDAFGETVANTQGMPLNLWNYYGVESIIFGGEAGAIMVTNDTKGSNPRSLASLNMTADINTSNYTLTFHNGGAPLQSDCYLQIPVKVKHYWGVLDEAKLYIKIQHTL